MKNRKLLLIVSLVLALTMSLGGTLAYLTDFDSDVNTMTLGSVKIEQHEYQRKDVNKDGKFDTTDTTTITEGDKTYTSYVLEAFEQDKPLLPIVGDPNEPGNSPAYAGHDETIVRMSQVDSYGSMKVFAGKNAVDKFVTVENTGVSPAYVRSYVAFEVGSTENKNPHAEGKALVMTGTRVTADANKAGTDEPWLSNPLGIVAINGNNYMVYEYVYAGAKLSDGTYRHENGILPGGDTTYPSLCQVYLKHNATNEDLEALDGNKNGTYDIIVLSQAVQADGFDDAATALNTGFGAATAANATDASKINVQVWLENASTTLPKVATNSDELRAEIAAGKEEVVLAAGEYTMPNADLRGKTLTITGTKDTVIDMTHVYDNGNQSFTGATMVYDGVTLNFANINYKGLAHTESVTYKNCTINGLQFLNAGDFTFENCILNSNGAEHCFWTWGAENVTVTNCDFFYGDRAVNCYAEHGETTAITFTDCSFTKVAGKATTGAIETNSSLMTSLSLNINGCSVNEGDLWWVSSYDNKQGENTTFNGQPVKAN